MKKALLVVVLIGARALGLFALARWMTRSELRILAYHGAALGDENRFSPGLFMSEATFAQRMAFLADRGYRVIGLDHALGALSRGDLPDFATVITMDDGWYGTCRLMSPILKRHGFPATFYVSTYYVEKQTQVFNVAVGYVLWKAAGPGRLDLSTLSSGLVGAIDLSEPRQRQAALDAIVEHAESLGDADARQDLLRRRCEGLDVDWGPSPRSACSRSQVAKRCDRFRQWALTCSCTRVATAFRRTTCKPLRMKSTTTAACWRSSCAAHSSTSATRAGSTTRRSSRALVRKG
jgi:hypothetical protein